MGDNFRRLSFLEDEISRFCDSNRREFIQACSRRQFYREKLVDIPRDGISYAESVTDVYSAQGPMPLRENLRELRREEIWEAFYFLARRMPLRLRARDGSYVFAPSTILDRRSGSPLFGNDRHPRYIFLEHKTYRVDLTPAKKLLKFLDLASSDEVLYIYNVPKSMMADSTLNERRYLRSIINYLEPLEGSILAFNIDDMPQELDIRLHLGMLCEDCINEVEDFGQKGAPGRPRKQEIALAAYERHFPNGHVGYTWGEVVNRLRVEEAVDVSTDTLKRALAPG